MTTEGKSPEAGIDSNPTEAEVSWLDGQLETFNTRQVGRNEFKPLNLVIRDVTGLVIAGLKALTGWDWLYVQVLWVHEAQRRQGLGTQLLQQAECEAASRGCIGACLSSYTFQAPEFYMRHGYFVFGRIDDYPVGGTMFFLSKRFGDTTRRLA